MDAGDCFRLWISSRFAQMRQDAGNDAPDRRIVDSGVNPVHITQGFLQPMPFCFQQNEFVRLFEARQSEGNPKFKRHVESHRKFYATQVMYGNRTLAHQPKDAGQPAVTLLWNLKHRSRRAPKCREGADQGDKERLVILVERNV